MKIGINGRFLVAKRTGVQRAAYNLLQTLVLIDKENHYYIFSNYDQMDNPDWNHPNVTVVPSKLREGENLRNHLWEQFTLPALSKKYGVDLLHSPANMAPLFYKGKSVVHIHDLCFVVNPQWYSFSFRTLYNALIPRIAKRSTRIITNSNNSRNDLLQFCSLSAEKVRLVYWAVDDFFQRIQREPRNQTKKDGNYILYVGSLEPRKNIGTLVEAFEMLRLRNPDLQTKLVLIGGENPLFAGVRLRVKRFREDILFKGFVSDEELKNYYCKATLVVYPSLYEGFGLPPLEAMASGTPVVTSMTSSLPEVVGDAAITINPYDTEQLATALATVIKDQDLSNLLIQRGYEQVKKFNWYRVARNTLAVYHEVYHEGHPVVGADAASKSHFLPRETWKRLSDLEASMLTSNT